MKQREKDIHFQAADASFLLKVFMVLVLHTTKHYVVYKYLRN